MHVQVKDSLAYLQDLMPILGDVFTYYFVPAKVGSKSCRHTRECFICACIWQVCLSYSIATDGLYMIYSFSNLLASYLFPYILL